ncbi:UDP-glycosyltransferase [Salegentibacter sp. F14]
MPKFPKILVISESIDTEDSSGTKGRVALIHNLKKIGCDLKVLHYTRKEIQLKNIPTIAIKENRKSLYFLLSRIERHLRKTLKIDIHKFLENIFGFSFTLYNDRDSIIKEIKKEKNYKPDFILTLSKGGSFRPHHALLKLPELHQKWIAYIHDPYPMHLYPPPFAWVEPGQFKKWEFVQNISEKALLPVFPSQLLMHWMGSYFPEFLQKGIIIPHQISDDVRIDIDLPDFFNPDAFNILHAGTLLGPRDPKPLVNAFVSLIERYPHASEEIRLIFIGKSSHHQNWLKAKSDTNESLKLIPGGIPYKTIRLLQNSSAVNVILEAKAQISPFLPGKFPHCVQANKPILLLGPALSESRRLLGESYPYWAEVSDEKRIFKLLEEMYLHWKKDPSLFLLNRKDLEEYLSQNHLSEVIKGLIK